MMPALIGIVYVTVAVNVAGSLVLIGWAVWSSLLAVTGWDQDWSGC